MKTRPYKSALSFIVLCGVLTNTAYSQGDDDSLLLSVPAMVASVAKRQSDQTQGLMNIKKLQGRWKFEYLDSDNLILFSRHFRFNSSTASATPDPTVFIIQGNGSRLQNFSRGWCTGGLSASYSIKLKSYLILCNWGVGEPDYDLGSAYIFNSVSESFPFKHYFYVPSSGEIYTDYFDNGTAERFSTTYGLLLNQALNNESTGNNMEEGIAEVKNKLYHDLTTNRAPTKKALTPSLQRIQDHLKKMISLQKDNQ